MTVEIIRKEIIIKKKMYSSFSTHIIFNPVIRPTVCRDGIGPRLRSFARFYSLIN